LGIKHKGAFFYSKKLFEKSFLVIFLTTKQPETARNKKKRQNLVSFRIVWWLKFLFLRFFKQLLRTHFLLQIRLLPPKFTDFCVVFLFPPNYSKRKSEWARTAAAI